MPAWFIETCVLTDERVGELREACTALDLACTSTLDVDQPPELRRPRPADGAEVIAYGSKSVIQYALSKKWRPGVWAGPAFDYQAVQAGLGDLFLNADAIHAPFDSVEAVSQQHDWKAVFIRPADDDKAFAGAVMETQSLPAWRERLISSNYLSTADFDVVVAAPKDIRREWRVVLAGDEIAGASLYRETGEKRLLAGCPAEVSALAQTAARRYRPASVFVADVVETSDRALLVIEYNTFNSADLYACDIGSIVKHVTATADIQGL